MPELPEVETTRRGIEPHILGRRVCKIAVRQPSLRWPVPDILAQTLVGRRIKSVGRRGKYLLLQVTEGTVLIHLGMSGSLRLVPRGTPPGSHDHVDIEFAEQTLRYHDPRRFGSILWQAGGQAGDALEHKLLQNLGPEPLTDEFNAELLFSRSRKKTAAIKTFLMDSKIVVGVGNIYANEALFMAGIKPIRKAGSLSRRECEALVTRIKFVLDRSIEQGGTTLRDFVGGDGKPGYFKQQLNVYGRGGEPCTGCAKTLKEIKLGQRATVYCTACQR
ncbi:bifunctional DNA-formamidopyrimidine glycosylase/DNA-(apurinic or apyrimidinic site) lyase [Gilvimarinus agarilyticus]|uniref:bifunctional DNA-formamidopyrimidine glycosylase/DNA-(apurinic or apyrimidinic site) lyase n=1 Tax=Gilvimarinus sp. 2_MG-2023 TaxID=3062666 RepID=UPI001C094856|nr:bifunctional DNA-formamidopyrimidine glycosylase/DNA-(apurinic or apyrimidinic site) lyase [Gilvimarinus sp. 2_MG-2023]MBU2884551.1 bifunctional DNA-formamidopyrimidine glycosylase/DNA-(apurinic or apyrimidinic site) lyase [Gilvimarinus agarilyticus]MDO6569679.1 bifunctional DNA-formamidopyrimidine glycosylase/DNA-(apurinic or apyrimidinic site) lyase [Gilvimarinus sp. 2_MG-2023]